MKKNIIGLAVVSVVALSLHGIQAAQRTSSENSKKVILVNDAGADLRFLVISGSPSTSGLLVSSHMVAVPKGKTKQIDGRDVMDITAFGPVNVSSGMPAVRVVSGSVASGEDSFVDVAGGTKLDFTNLFNQLINKKSGSITITVGPTTAGGLIATAQIK